MRPEREAESRDWLIRASRDLLMAERALNVEPQLLDAVAYHAQQAAEKALKGFLAGHGVAFPRSHDLAALVSQCEAIDPSLGDMTGAAVALTPFAVAFRYPGGPLEPEVEEAQEALDLASGVVARVQALLAVL